MILDKREITLEAAKTNLAKMLIADFRFASALFIVLPEVTSSSVRRVTCPRSRCCASEGANVYDLLRYQQLVLTPASVAALQRRLAS